MRARCWAFPLGLLMLAGCLAGRAPDPAPPEALDYRLDCSVAPGAALPWWPEPCLAMASPNPSTAKVEVDIAVNPRDPLNIVVASKDKDPEASDCVWSVAQVTKDGGKTWATVYVGGDKDHRVPETTGYECVTDPIMVFDAQGVFYYALQIYDHTPFGNPSCPPQVPDDIRDRCPFVPDTGSAFILARSLDGGVTYDRFMVQAEGAGDLVFHDYPRMLVNPKTGSIHTIWNAYIAYAPAPAAPDPSGYRPVASRYRPGQSQVDPPLVITREDDPRGQLAFFSGFAATTSGDIYVTMQRDEDSDAGERTKVWIWKSTDDGSSYQEVGEAFEIHPTRRQHGDHRFRTPSFVEMAIAPAVGAFPNRMYTFWTENQTLPGGRYDSDLLSRFSDDGGRTWSGPVSVAANASGGQYFMRPRVNDAGRVLVLYNTQAHSGSELLDQELAWSDDGGTTWEHLRLTSVSYDGDLGIHQNDFPFIGDYNGLVIGPDGVVHAAWGHTGPGRAEIAYARVVPRDG